MPTEDRTARRGPAAGRWLIEETGWLFLLALPWIALGTYDAMIAALFGLHGSVLVYAVWREWGRLSDRFRLRPRDVLAGLAGGGAILLLGGAYGLALEKAGVELPDAAAQMRSLVPDLGVLLLWGAVLVPVTEELFFRGRMLRVLDGLAGRKASTLVSSAAFMLVHGIPEAFPAYFTFGLIFAVLRRRTGGLAAPTVAHAVNNFFGIVFGGG